MQFFTIKYDGSDYSVKLKDFGTAPVPLALVTTKELTVGYRKPFKQFFVELSDKNTAGGTLSLEYYDGTTWQPLDSTIDETENFSKSGFIFFEKPSAWKADGDDLFTVRLKTDTDHSLTTAIQGLAILLSNDLDLEGVRSNIVTKLNGGDSWVLKHEQARKDIIQVLRNKGNRIVKNADKINPLITEGMRFADVTEFDLLEPTQLRQASLYLTLSMIYLDELSDNIEDKWQIQGRRYAAMYAEMVDTFYLQVDYDDDGLADDFEVDNSTETKLQWR